MLNHVHLPSGNTLFYGAGGDCAEVDIHGCWSGNTGAIARIRGELDAAGYRPASPKFWAEYNALPGTAAAARRAEKDARVRALQGEGHSWLAAMAMAEGE